MGKLTGGSTDYYKIPPGATNKPAGGRQMKEDTYKNRCESLYRLNTNLMKQNQKLRQALKVYAYPDLQDEYFRTFDQGNYAKKVLEILKKH